MFGGGGWFLEKHGRIGVHAKRVAWTQTSLAILLILGIIVFVINRPSDPDEYPSQTTIHLILLSIPISILVVINIVMAAVSFQYAK